MIHSKSDNVRFTYAPSVLLYGAVLLLIVPIRLLLAAAISAAVHEFFHILAMCFLNVRINEIQVGIRGVKICSQSMTQKEELVCAISGPAGGLLLFLCGRWMPVIGLCGLVQTCYNLIPLYPTDGGRVMHCAAEMLFPAKVAKRLVYAVEVGTLSVIVAACIYGTVFLRLGIIPMVFAASLLLRSAGRK